MLNIRHVLLITGIAIGSSGCAHSPIASATAAQGPGEQQKAEDIGIPITNDKLISIELPVMDSNRNVDMARDLALEAFKKKKLSDSNGFNLDFYYNQFGQYIIVVTDTKSRGPVLYSVVLEIKTPNGAETLTAESASPNIIIKKGNPVAGYVQFRLALLAQPDNSAQIIESKFKFSQFISEVTRASQE